MDPGMNANVFLFNISGLFLRVVRCGAADECVPSAATEQVPASEVTCAPQGRPPHARGSSSAAPHRAAKVTNKAASDGHRYSRWPPCFTLVCRLALPLCLLLTPTTSRYLFCPSQYF
ncbi:hypothetical protein E2C01_075194 [Portunus trituberculatus]|uniref:Uncharacterized protein n=1 Tax=Portunus trituberculatus TaxID=210409 RepID=A0A5B7I5I4_PORTR|nr:hypothetical protein [Portunus trituberculatus]